MTQSTKPPRFLAALVQLRSSRDADQNISEATRLIRDAAAAGAVYVQTPENTTLMELEREQLFAHAKSEADDPAVQHFAALAKELGVHLHIGSIAVRTDGDKLANRSLLFTPEGRISARYDKIHMFDVDLPGGESYKESRNFAAGKHAVVADLPWGGLGMTICYDLRFPYLHRALAKAGARFIASPAAFTRVTGEAHWHVLLRARAIETQCFVLAAAQGGRHQHGRETFGHSLIVAPWGEVLADGGTEPGIVTAEIDLARLEAARTRLPSLTHDRDITLNPAFATDAAE
jgi:predicted amidohydrolase